MNKMSPFIIVLKYQLRELEIRVEPLEKNGNGVVNSFQLHINEENSGVIFCLENKWIANHIEDPILVDRIGHCIRKICEKYKEFIGKENMFNICLN